MSELTVQQEEKGHRGAFFLEKDGARVGEMTFSRTSPKLVMIDHTDVDDSLRGQGAGRKMLDAMIAWARKNDTKLLPVCPYAKAQFEKDPSIRDVLST
jgi:predicted GNAT family acetyltransferase